LVLPPGGDVVARVAHWLSAASLTAPEPAAQGLPCRGISGAMSRVAVFLHSGDYERMHQGLSVAAAAAASGREVLVFFFWWALERLVADRLDEPDFAGEQARAADRFESRQLPTLRQLLEHARQSGK